MVKLCYECGEELKLQEPGGSQSFFWECPECSGRWVPGKAEDTDAEKLFNQEIEDKKKLCKFGGSSSSGRKREKKKPDIKYWLPEE